MKQSKWQAAVKEQIKALEMNETWKLSKLTEGNKPDECKWIFLSNTMLMVVSAGTWPPWWLRGSPNLMGWTVKKRLHSWQN